VHCGLDAIGADTLQIVYLLYLVIGEGKTIPVLSIVLLAAIYGLQALIFIFRLRWDMIAWMICE
jgi:chitin synthase